MSPEPSDRLLTLPNVISVVRLCFVPVFVWALFSQDDRYLAAWILAILGASDGVDGYIARHYNQVTKFGSAFDPIADRILLITAIVCLAIDGSMPWWLIILAGVRELAVSIMTVIMTSRGLPRFPVHWFGKAGTLCLMVSAPLYLVANADVNWSSIAQFVAPIFGVLAVVFGWIAFVIYARRWAQEARTLSNTGG